MPIYASKIKISDNNSILIVIYVDDIIMTSNDVSMIEKIKSNMSKAFDMTGLGFQKCCLTSKTCQEFA